MSDDDDESDFKPGQAARRRLRDARRAEALRANLIRRKGRLQEPGGNKTRAPDDNEPGDA